MQHLVAVVTDLSVGPLEHWLKAFAEVQDTTRAQYQVGMAAVNQEETAVEAQDKGGAPHWAKMAARVARPDEKQVRHRAKAVAEIQGRKPAHY